jgi:hypothetical protein
MTPTITANSDTAAHSPATHQDLRSSAIPAGLVQRRQQVETVASLDLLAA